MDLKQFEYVLTVNEERSFSKAAKRLFISQPSLSQYINRLETQLGVTIFDRNTTPLTLTYEGELYIETALNILNIMENLQKKFDDVSNMKIGRLNIGLTPSKANNPLPAILPVFKEKYPGIDFIITEASSSELEDLLSRGLVDLCLMNLPIKSKNIEYEEILSEKMYLAAPPTYNGPEQSKGEKYPYLDIKALGDESFILLHPDQRVRQIADSVFANAGIKPKVLLETSSIETALRLSAAGMGFCFVPESYIESSGLVCHPKFYSFGEPAFSWTLVIAYRQNAYRTKAALAFADIVKEVIGKKEED
jgi:DNA-binding transcriptional LysR family regulator